ncbi:MAG: hypothetical protein HGA85_05635 [Nanoarchaeota archaeon]|nr:hypothetical protein [Nanoarchaeota archaeon]
MAITDNQKRREFVTRCWVKAMKNVLTAIEGYWGMTFFMEEVPEKEKTAFKMKLLNNIEMFVASYDRLKPVVLAIVDEYRQYDMPEKEIVKGIWSYELKNAVNSLRDLCKFIKRKDYVQLDEQTLRAWQKYKDWEQKLYEKRRAYHEIIHSYIPEQEVNAIDESASLTFGHKFSSADPTANRV